MRVPLATVEVPTGWKLGIKPPEISSKAGPMAQASPFECWAVRLHPWILEMVQVAVWRKNYQFW